MTAQFIYVGIRKSDGSMRAMSYDDEGAEEQTAFCVSDWIRRGLMVVRMSEAEYRSRLNPTTPPPIPDLVQQVAAVASAPPGCRPDLSQADQSPFACFGGTDPDDAKTRLIHRAEQNDFPPV